MKESKFLGTILIESPLMFEILEKIRDKHNIDKLDPSKDPYKQRADKPFPLHHPSVTRRAS